jgi:hypothetical protein
VDSAERIVAGMGWKVAFAADDENECVHAVAEGDCDFGVLRCWTGADELANVRDIEP